MIDISTAASAAAPAVAAKPTPAPAPVPAVVAAAVGGNDSLIPFKLADIGEGIAEVELMKWFVKVR